MATIYERQQNLAGTASVNTGVTLNSSTSVKIADANPNRIYFYVTNDGSTEEAWIKLQAAGVDNDKKGIFLNKKAIYRNDWGMPVDNVYTGEICAIAEAGTPSVYVTEY